MTMMSQLGFFDIANRYAGLDAKNDPLVKLDAVVPWEDFRSRLEATWRWAVRSLMPRSYRFQPSTTLEMRIQRSKTADA